MIERVRPTHLVHLAWCTEHGTFWRAPDNLSWLRASLELVETFVATGQRLVTVGSCAEYLWDDGWCIERSTPTRPATLYGAAKLALGVLSDAMAASHKISAAHARIFQLYSAHEAPGRLVASVIDACLDGREARCSDGCQVRDFLHAADVAAAIDALLFSDAVGPVNIGSGQAVLLREIISLVGELTGRGDLIRLGALSQREGDPLLLLPKVDRLFNEVGWRPSLGLKDGLRAVIAERRTSLH